MFWEEMARLPFHNLFQEDDLTTLIQKGGRRQPNRDVEEAVVAKLSAQTGGMENGSVSEVLMLIKEFSC